MILDNVKAELSAHQRLNDERHEAHLTRGFEEVVELVQFLAARPDPRSGKLGDDA